MGDLQYGPPSTFQGWSPSFGVLDSSAGSSPANGGTGYSVGDLINLGNGVEIIVGAVSGGAVTNFGISQRGSATTVPTNPVAQVSTTGSGHGATFTLSWGPIAASIGFFGANSTLNGATVLGYEAGIGMQNVALGPTAFGLFAAGTGSNTGDGFGGGTGMTNNAAENTFIGYNCGTQITTGQWNTYVGHHAGGHETTGNFEVFVGTDSGKFALHGSEIVGVGRNTLKLLGNSPARCVGLGSNALIGALYQPTISGAANNGSGLIRLTVSSTTGMLTGDYPVSVTGVVGTTEANGVWTITVIDGTHIDLQGSTFAHAYVSGGTIIAIPGGPSDCVAVGYNALSAANIRAPTQTVAIGSSAGLAITGGTGNVIVGHNAGSALTTGGNNTVLGFSALSAATTDGFIVAIGTSAMNASSGAGGSIGIGNSTLANAASANMVGVGPDAGQFATNASSSIFIGNLAGQGVSTGTPLTGQQSVYVGYQAGRYVGGSGGLNTYVGGSAGQGTSGTPQTGAMNTAVGWQAGLNIQGTASNNAIFGVEAGKALTSGSSNVVLGPLVASTTLATGLNNVLIGTSSNIDTASGSTSNTIQIGAGSTAVISATGCGTPSTSVCTHAGSLVVNSATGGITVGSSGPTLTSGAGAPSATQPVGSLYLNTSGASGARLYVSAGSGSWNAVSGV